MIFFVDFYTRLISLTFDKFYLFFCINKFILLFIFITYVLIIFDDRFKLKNKLFILLFILFFMIFLNIYDYMDLHIFIKELYWYCLVLNGSFIIHVCWLHWIYKYFWVKRNNSKYLSKENIEFICEIVKNISFILSLSFLVLLLNHLIVFVRLLFRKFQNHKKIAIMFLLIFNIGLLVVIIIRFFIYIFIVYSNFIIGNSDYNMFQIKHLITYAMYFIFSWIIAYYVFGISRLLFNWFLIFIIRSYQIFKNYVPIYNDNYEKLKLSNKDAKLLKLKSSSYKYINVLKYFFLVDFQDIMNIAIVEEQDKYFKDWYNKCYIRNFNIPQLYYLFFNKKYYKNIAKEPNKLEIFKSLFKHIFIYKDSWYETTRVDCMRILYDVGYESDLEFYELLNNAVSLFNLTEDESKDLIFEYYKNKQIIEKYGGLENVKKLRKLGVI